MAEIGVKELKATASAVIEQVEAGAAFVVTKGGRAAAVLMPIEEAEDLVLANANEYVKQRRAARSDHAKGRTVRLGYGLTAYQFRLGRAAAKQYARLDPGDRDRVRQALLRLAQDAGASARIGGKRVKTIRGPR